MNLYDIEKEITPKLKWGKIEEIPSFPAKSFEELKRMIQSQTLQIGADFSTSNLLAESLYGKAYANFHYFLTWIPIIIAVLSLILAFILGNYWFIVGVPLSLSSMILANPYNPFKHLMTLLALILILVSGYGIWNQNETLSYLPIFFIIPFFIIRLLYNMNQKKLINTALRSEQLLIYLYQTHSLYLKDSSSGLMYSYWEEN